MTAEQFFISLSGANSTYIKSAAQSLAVNTASKPQKNRRPLRYLLIAATLTLILAAILLPIALGKDRTTIPDITTSTPTTTEKIYASITDIPGATTPSSFNTTLYTPSGFNDYKQWFLWNWAYHLRNNCSAVVGRVLEYDAVDIPVEEGFWRLYTIQIAIDEQLCNNGNKSTKELTSLSAVYACQYIPSSNDDDAGPYRLASYYQAFDDNGFYCDMGAIALQYSDKNFFPGEVVFQLESAQTHTITLNGETVNLSDYAPFFMTASMGRFDGYIGIDKLSFPSHWIMDTPEETLIPVYSPFYTLFFGKGAMVKEFPERSTLSAYGEASAYIESLPKDHAMLYATPQNIERRIIRDGDTEWFLISFDLSVTEENVIKNISPIPEPYQPTVRVLYAAEYRKVGNSYEAVSPNAADKLMELLSGDGVFVLVPADAYSLTISSESTSVDRFCDYVLLDVFESDGKTILFPSSLEETHSITIDVFKNSIVDRNRN